MKYEEALKLVEKCGFNIEAPLESEVEELVRKALEKQIPKRPYYEGDGYADGVLVYDTAFCPVCNHEFEEGINEWGSDYCQDCGQALDWSEESEDTE